MAKPGNELAKLIKGDISLGPFHVNISMLGFVPAPDCDCQTRIDLMNQWGVVGCKRNIHRIARWLKQSAMRHNISLPNSFYYNMVELAIHNAEKV